MAVLIDAAAALIRASCRTGGSHAVPALVGPHPAVAVLVHAKLGQPLSCVLVQVPDNDDVRLFDAQLRVFHSI